jgi:hypothetical protein
MPVNNLGFGSLASVAWTDMNGTLEAVGTSDTTSANAKALAEVNKNKSKAETIANGLLLAIKASVNQEWTQFSLFDFVTDNTVSGQTRVETLSDWTSFIKKSIGFEVSATKSLSPAEWRRVAADLQDYAAKEASKRDTTNGGGIKNVNGHWYINGQQVALLDVYMAVRVNQVANFDDAVNIYIEELNSNNTLVKQANDWLAKMRKLKPDNTTDSVAWTAVTAQAASWQSTWGTAYNPASVFMPNANQTTGKADRVDTWIEEVKSYVDSKDSDNQTVQQKLEQMTNRRGEVLEGLTSFVKSQSQTGQSFARNLG